MALLSRGLIKGDIMRRVSLFFVFMPLMFAMIGCGTGGQKQWIVDFERIVQNRLQPVQGPNGQTTFFVNPGTTGSIPQTVQMELSPTDIFEMEWKVMLDEDNDLMQIHVETDIRRMRNSFVPEIQTAIYAFPGVNMEGSDLIFVPSQEDLEMPYGDLPPRVKILQISRNDLRDQDAFLQGEIIEVPKFWISQIKSVYHGEFRTIQAADGNNINTEVFFKLEYQDVQVELAQSLSQSYNRPFDENAIPVATEYVAIWLQRQSLDLQTFTGLTTIFDTYSSSSPTSNSSTLFGNR